MYKSGDSNNYSYSYPMWELGETIVFNNGKGVSTIGVSVIEDQTYYTKGEMNSNNRLIIYPNDGEDNFPAVYFTNHQGWSNVFAYAWDENGNALLGGWPGVQMTDEGINDYGEDIYSVIVPYGAVGLVFSSGDGDQTADVIRGNDGFKSSYYTTDERDEQGHLIVFAHYYHEIYFINNCGWTNVYVYAEDTYNKPILGSIPGIEMKYEGENDFGESVYKVRIPDEAVTLTFFSGEFGEQTVNTGAYQTFYRPTGLRDSSNRLRFDYDHNIIEDTYTIKLTNNFGWDEINVYAWDEDGNSLLGDWPGTAMTYYGENAYGEAVYQYH